MKSIFGLLFCICLIVVLLPVFGVSAASPENDFTFDATTGTITKYIGSDGDVEIPATIGGIGVVAIGEYAFSGCSSVTNINIPGNVTSIRNTAFANCTGLTSIIVQPGNTIYKSKGNCIIEISTNKLIAGCKASVIPDYVICIDNNAFYACYGLTSINIPNSVTIIGESAFNSCADLTSISIPDSVTIIGNYAFYECFGLINVIILDGVTTIGRDAFAYCTSLASINIPDSVITIENGAFNNCTDLTRINIPDSVTTIGYSAFAYCAGLTSINIPDSIAIIELYAFSGCSGLTNMTVQPGNIIYKSEGNCIIKIATNKLISGCKTSVIPDYVTIIEDGAFFSCYGLININIPDGVITIGNGAFQNCTGLTSINIPDSVITIGNSAFNGCTGLTSIIISNNVTTIEVYTFYNCPGLTSIIIPDSVTTIGNYAFNFCSGLKNIIIPANVTTVGDSAFWICTDLTSITFNSSATTIYSNECTIPIAAKIIGHNPSTAKNYALKYNRTFELIASPESDFTFNPSTGTVTGYTGSGGDVVIPAKIGGIDVTAIGEQAFNHCYDITSIKISDNVTTVGNYAFYECFGLTSLEIPDSVTTIGNYVFSNCTGLFYVNIPGYVTVIGNYAFNGCTGLTYINITDSVSVIGNNAFENCSGLTSIILSDSVISIGDYAFAQCSGLTSIIIPDSVTTTGFGVFYNCFGLTSIIFNSPTTTIYDDESTIPTAVIIIGDNPSAAMDYAVKYNRTFFNFDSSTGTITGYTGFEGDIRIPVTLGGIAVVGIGDSTFADYTSLTSINIPGSITTIGNSAFAGCTGLTSIIIPDSVLTIGNSAFTGCTGLTSIIIPDSVTAFGNSMFTECTGLLSIKFISLTTIIFDSENTIPPETIIMGYDPSTAKNYAVKYNRTFKVIAASPEGDFKFDPSMGTITGYYGPGGEVIIPDKIGGIDVIAIGEQVFSHCYSLTSVIIPDSITNIGLAAFAYCSGLTSINIPEGITIISESAFASCSKLTSIIIPDSVIIIEEAAFGSCTGLTSINIPDSVTSIGNDAFICCTGLTSVNISDSVTIIGEEAFAYCSGLTNINIPNSIIIIKEYAFYCSGLTSITIPDSVTTIGVQVFVNCLSLKNYTVSPLNQSFSSDEYGVLFNKDKSILLQYPAGKEQTTYLIPESVTTIGEWAFDSCSGLTDINISDSVIVIGDMAFNYCSGLTSIIIPDSVTTIGMRAFNYCTGLTSIFISDSVTTIKYAAFENCSGLTNIFIPNNVMIIEDYTFYKCSGLISVNIPDSVTIIGQGAFSNCSNLTSVNMPDSVTIIESYVFNGSQLFTTIYGIPGSYAETYANSNGYTFISNEIIYDFKGVCIKLIEPWGLRFYTVISGSGFTSGLPFGTIVLREDYYTAGMTAEEMMADSHAIILTSESGDSVLDASSRIVGTMVGGIYTYNMNTSFYTVAYVVINGEYIFSPVNSRNIYDRVVYLKDNSSNNYEKAIYQEMYNLYTDVKNYHNYLGHVVIPERPIIKRGSECSPGTVSENNSTVVYDFKGVAIRLIEPWGLCFYTGMTTADIGTVTEFGTVVLSEDNYTVGMTGEEMRLSDNSYVFNSADGTAVYDSSKRIAAKLVDGIYTYNMDKVFYMVSYTVIDGEYYYSGVNSRNMYDRVALLKDTSSNAYEKEIYGSMYSLYGAVDAYHRDLGLK